MENLFALAKFGDRYITRNGSAAYYCRFDGKKHCLMVNDKENDFISCNENGHVFDVDELDKPIVGGKHDGQTVVEVYGWNREEMVNFRLDIVSRYEEPIDEEKLDKHANDYFVNTYNNGVVNQELDIINEKKFAVADFKAGYRAAKQE